MAGFMKPFEEKTYALLRIFAGFMFLWHGAQNLFGFPMAASEMPAFVQYGAGSIEFFGGFLVMIGFFTGWAAFLSSGLMAVAYWMVHGMQAFLPIQNQGEMAVLYCFIFLFISAKGSGIWSVDASRGAS